MSDEEIHPNKYSELRSIYKYYIDACNALYQLKTEKEEDLISIYKMIKTELIDSNKHPPQIIMRDILNIIPYNNRYTKSYLLLAKFIYDDYQVKELRDIDDYLYIIFYEEYGIKLTNFSFLEKLKLNYFEIPTENTIHRAIMYNDKERFISFIEREGFDNYQKLQSDLYPHYFTGYSLLELCCYHGAVDCFKFLRTKFDSEITQTCLDLSFLGGNPEIMSECLKYQKPNKECMENAIISHNIDFVTFLMNEYNIKIDLEYCGEFNNLESFFVYFDQTNDINKCFIYSMIFGLLSLCEYFISHGANVNEKDKNGETALHFAAIYNSKETIELLISQGANINEKDGNWKTALHVAAENNSKETAELLISYGANINERDKYGETALHYAAEYNSKDTAEIFISYGANINEKK
ncbi:hypothetical protein TVAG_405220 [Trichomonas vaginalis G3]|uniref:DUF3447 domain-containing protein n=1 Tax=Trichomonas vaginalis (strain ATCC PRA-98 / G3) TaxID=412133 RepID=A2E340_TRIV3|nr:protein ubiquitination [Trichomonas vaginalis G3]EAY12976.1 hypothetical protein TVAG_405220 [Trichomonas vaginalis G3]KAI5499799.1 protein ubiquitination [Trichomonas vaginalis G3]|eukprot:XP_001325199.1 hypothetical protein [Trichomonas vaginalis G3]